MMEPSAQTRKQWGASSNFSRPDAWGFSHQLGGRPRVTKEFFFLSNHLREKTLYEEDISKIL